MRILHTSDWHIGRTFHGHSTLPALREVLEALTATVAEKRIDVVAIAGDVFDSATPSGESFDVLTATLGGLRDAGARVVMTSGNHDSASRLGFQAAFAAAAGIHVLTRVEQHDVPVEIDGVDFYGIPYLEPSLIRHRYPGETLRTQADAVSFAMRGIRDALRGPSVVLSHCFAAGVEASDVEREIRAGGLDVVPMSAFDGPDYVALGHIHGRSTLSPRVRYSGAPLHYSFAEAAKPRGGWLVDVDAGAEATEWIDLPVPRALSVITGTLDELLTDDRFDAQRDDWVSAILTDTSRPIDAMRKLQTRFPWCATLDHRPAETSGDGASNYAERVKAKSDPEIIAGFLEHVRGGDGPTPEEERLIADVIGERAGDEAAA
ncbi:exonuclease SbcCD subunit D [Agromyces atrinae]|uniref:Nuclease SbcCD subunit D n=1 Tax=Agromyces atrinae TaxID=592376 RepID=A0A4Q2M9F0_9MICO|nr:exonuclease SbcCD subunit D [Agromyces atrinae]NYD65541.1 exonuclease SbcD [Agromyces atrinae]RXZ85730.1 exonuclease SbcCD subunit D [Agromyces atrinae]